MVDKLEHWTGFGWEMYGELKIGWPREAAAMGSVWAWMTRGEVRSG